MTALAQKLDRRLSTWRPEVVEEVSSMIAEVIELDQVDREEYFAQLQPAPPSSGSQVSSPKPQHWLARLFKRLRSWV